MVAYKCVKDCEAETAGIGSRLRFASEKIKTDARANARAKARTKAEG
jgi:hypothetical protein